MSKRKSVSQEPYRPLQNKKFYLDFKTYRPNTHFVNDLRSLGAMVEPFFGREIAYVITDRPDYKKASLAQKPNSVDSSGQTTSPPFSNGFLAESPSTSASPSPEGRPSFRMARGQSMLDHVVKPKPGPTDILELCHLWQIKVLFVKNVLMWIQQLKQNSLLPTPKVGKQEGSKTKPGTDTPQKLIAPFIKVEDTSCQYKPLCRSLKRWPDIDLDRPAVVAAPAPELPRDDAKWPTGNRDVLKEQQPKAKVVEEKKYNCEICGCSYTYLRKHLLSNSHQQFMQNSSNFTALGQLISTLPCGELKSELSAPLTNWRASTGLAEAAAPSVWTEDYKGPEAKAERGEYRVLFSVKNNNSNINIQSAYRGELSNVRHLRVVKRDILKSPVKVKENPEKVRSAPAKGTTSAATCKVARCRSEDCGISPDDYIVLPSVLTEDGEKENIPRSESSDIVGVTNGHSTLNVPQPEGLALQLAAQSNFKAEPDNSTVEYSWTMAASGIAVDGNSYHQNGWSDADSSYQWWVSTAEDSTSPDNGCNGVKEDKVCNRLGECSFTSGTSSCF